MLCGPSIPKLYAKGYINAHLGHLSSADWGAVANSTMRSTSISIFLGFFILCQVAPSTCATTEARPFFGSKSWGELLRKVLLCWGSQMGFVRVYFLTRKQLEIMQFSCTACLFHYTVLIHAHCFNISMQTALWLSPEKWEMDLFKEISNLNVRRRWTVFADNIFES